MVTPEEFRKAVEVVHTALRERVVTMGLTTHYNCMHKVVSEVVITGRHPKARATYYYEKSDGYTESTVMGTQDNFEVAVMTQEERVKLDVENARTKYAEALRSNAVALASKERELAQSQIKLQEAELELARLGAAKS